MAKKVKVDEFMNGYETRIFNGYRKTIGDRLKDKRVFSNMLREALLTNVVKVDENGEAIYVPIGADLIAKKLNYLYEHPEDIDLKEISAVLGEAKLETENTVRGADELFGDIVIKTKR